MSSDANGPLFSIEGWTVTNGTLGPVLWCPHCGKQIGFLVEHVSLDSLADAAGHHMETRHP